MSRLTGPLHPAAASNPDVREVARVAALERRLSELERSTFTSGLTVNGDATFGGTLALPRHRFQSGVNGDTTQLKRIAGGTHSILEVAAGDPTGGWAELELRSSYRVADDKVWNLAARGDNGEFVIRSVNDARTVANIRAKLSRTGSLTVEGTQAGFHWTDRTDLARIWGWYTSGNMTRLWNNVVGDVFQVSVDGDVHFRVSRWHRDSNGQQRIHFGNNGPSYYDTPSGQSHNWRVGNVDVGYFRSNGELQWYRPIRQLGGTQNWNDLGWPTADFEIRRGEGTTNNTPRLALHIPNVNAMQLRAHRSSANWCQLVNDNGTGWGGMEGVFSNMSDVRVKGNPRPVAKGDALGKVRKMPVNRFEWTEKDGKPRRRGPMNDRSAPVHEGLGINAQDFHAAFPGLYGAPDPNEPEQPSTIITTDALGVLFAAVQALADELDLVKAGSGTTTLPATTGR